MTVTVPWGERLATRPAVCFAALALCAALLFLVGLGQRALWNVDEPRVAGIATAMAVSGDAVTPRLNGEPFLEYPPLYYWSAAAAYSVFGRNELAARLPSALAAMGCVLLVFRFALALGYRPLTALWSGLILATMLRFWTLGRTCMVDMMLCLAITLAVVGFQRVAVAGRRWGWWYAGFVVGLAAGLMAKGLLGFALPGVALGAWLVVRRDFSLRTWGLLALGYTLALLPVGGWLWFLCERGGREAVWRVVWLNNFGRFSGSYQQHIEPWYYYLEKWPAEMVPWVLFVPAAVLYHVRDLRQRGRGAPAVFMIMWFAAPFVLLSIAAGKRYIYLLPTWPPVALLLGTALGALLDADATADQRRWCRWSLILLAVTLTGAPLGMAGFCVWHRQPVWLTVLVSLPVLVAALVGWRLLLRQRLLEACGVLAGTLVAFFMVMAVALMPIDNGEKSFQGLFDYGRRLAADGHRLVLLQPSEGMAGAAVFYLGRSLPVLTDEAAVTPLLASDSDTVVLARERDLAAFSSPFDVYGRFRMGGKSYVAIGPVGTGSVHRVPPG